MAIRYFALVFGIVFLLVGIAGFVPGLLTDYVHPDHELAVDSFAYSESSPSICCTVSFTCCLESGVCSRIEPLAVRVVTQKR